MERGEQRRVRVRRWVTEVRDAFATAEVEEIDDIARTRYKIPEAKIPERRRFVINSERNRASEFLDGFAGRKKRRRIKRLARYERLQQSDK